MATLDITSATFTGPVLSVNIFNVVASDSVRLIFADQSVPNGTCDFRTAVALSPGHALDLANALIKAVAEWQEKLAAMAEAQQAGKAN